MLQRFNTLNVCGSVTYISWSSDFVLYIEDFLIDDCCMGDIDMCRSVTYISWCSDSTLYLEYYLMNTPHSLDSDSV